MLLPLVAASSSQLLATQVNAETTEILRSGTRDFAIVDDGDRLPATLVDEPTVDTYVYHPARGWKQIDIITDRGARRFRFERGDTVDFVIEYQGRPYRQRLAPVEQHNWAGPDSVTLPFRLGPDNAILITASINGSRPLDLLFDTGASVSVLSRRAPDVGASFTSTAGKLQSAEVQIGDVIVRNTPVFFREHAGHLKADGVLGYNVFFGRRVEVDYRRRELRIRKAGAPKPEAYRTVPIRWLGPRAMVDVTIDDGTSVRQLPMLLDTGSKFAVSLNNRDPLAARTGGVHTAGWRFARTSDGHQVVSRVFDMPSVMLGGFVLKKVRADIERLGDRSGLPVHILGNDFLKRFDLVIDYRDSVMYIRPNALATEPYGGVNLRDDFLIAAVSAVIIVAILLWRRRRQLSSTHQ